MNLLFGALLLILLLLPGVAFRLGYLLLPFSSKTFRSSFLEELLFSIVPAFLFGVAGYLLVDAFLVPVNERQLFLLLINSDKAATTALTARAIGLFALYLVVLNAVAFSTGAGFRRLAIRQCWHLRFSFLRIYNEWQLYFEGIILDYPEVPGQSADVTAQWLDVLVETKGESYLYCGLLEDYVIDREEKLDRLYLSAVRRRRLSDDPPAEVPGQVPPEIDYDDAQAVALEESQLADTLDKRYYFMPGNYFLIPGRDIRNINITYLKAELEGDAGVLEGS